MLWKSRLGSVPAVTRRRGSSGGSLEAKFGAAPFAATAFRWVALLQSQYTVHCFGWGFGAKQAPTGSHGRCAPDRHHLCPVWRTGPLWDRNRRSGYRSVPGAKLGVRSGLIEGGSAFRNAPAPRRSVPAGSVAHEKLGAATSGQRCPSTLYSLLHPLPVACSGGVQPPTGKTLTKKCKEEKVKDLKAFCAFFSPWKLVFRDGAGG